MPLRSPRSGLGAATVEPMPDTPQEPTAPTPDYDERGVPSLDYVRTKIEDRFATALGAQELADGTAQGRSLDEQEAQRKEAADVRLAEIRRSLMETMDE